MNNVEGITMNAPYIVGFKGISAKTIYATMQETINSIYRYGASAVASAKENAFNKKNKIKLALAPRVNSKLNS